MKGFIFLGLCLNSVLFLAQNKTDSIKETQIQEIRFTKKLPITLEIINVKKDLENKNLGQDLPILLKNQTSIIATSDAGNGVGYTGFRIRGVSGADINVMMNGVPFNDAESQVTFFVDVPDLTSSASQIIIQRGVGTSSNGVSAFGASINVVSKNPDEKFSLKTDDSYGSFNTYKLSGEINTGNFWKNRLSLLGRFTKIHSDGYINRAFSNLDSYNFTALFKENKTKLRFLAFGGKEKTYQAWNGIDKNTWENNPKFNISGAIYNQDGSQIVDFYKNETDNYRQQHYQMLWSQNFNDSWNLQTTLHYTKGKGYFENYKQNEAFSTYHLPNENGQTNTDFIRKKWLDNDFYGFISTLYGKTNAWDFNFGILANQYYGRHYGSVSGVFFPNIKDFEYYRNRSVKNELSGFTKVLFRMDNVELFGDLQLRNINYNTKILKEGDSEGINLNKNWLFFNPKAGVSYLIQNGKVYFSYANAHREPNREDLIANPETLPESLHDFEAGLEKTFNKIHFSANLYYMHYTNQLVLNGQINQVGEFIRSNSGKSFRTGLEIAGHINFSEIWTLNANLTLSQNKNLDYKQDVNGKLQNLGKTNISFSPDLIGNLFLGYNPIKNLSFGLQNQYVGSQFLDNTNNANLKLPPYFLMDFNAKYAVDFSKIKMNFKFLLNNMLNEKYVNNGYVGEVPIYFSQAGINFLFGVSLEFK